MDAGTKAASKKAITTYAQYCVPDRYVQPLDPEELPPLGAHLVAPWLGYARHGIYVGDGRVMHCGALMYDIIRKPVEEVSLAAFAEGRPVFIERHAESGFDAEEVVRRARSRLGEKRYRLIANNCEHFVEWCLHDVHRSFQVVEFPRWIGERILARVWQCLQREAPSASIPATKLIRRRLR
jgi:hypothetical protein